MLRKILVGKSGMLVQGQVCWTETRAENQEPRFWIHGLKLVSWQVTLLLWALMGEEQRVMMR